jgi:hypothetical protein
MEGVEAKIEWRINEDCLMEFRTRRSGGSQVVRVSVAAAFSVYYLGLRPFAPGGQVGGAFSRSSVSMND